MSAETVAAWVGAVTGTIACAYNLWQWRVDRGNVSLSAVLHRRHDPHLHVDLTITAVNNGRRPVKINCAGALLSTTSVPLPAGLPPEKQAQIKKSLTGLSSHELQIHESPAIELAPDGGDKIWTFRIDKGMEFLADSEGEERYGKAYIQLTSGEMMFCKFRLPKESEWPLFILPC